MPASTEQKVDFLLKKIGYSASKTGGVEGSSGTVDGTSKKPSEEAIPSPLIVPSTSIWADSSLIPATPPGSDTFPVKVYATSSAFRLTVDNTVSESRSFVARSTYGNQSSSIDGNWIDSQFGADYAVRVFKGDPNSGGVELAQAGATGNDTWFFDYSSGILNFNGTDNHSTVGVTDTNIYIVGYRYTGGTGSKPPTGIGTFSSLNVTGIATFHKDVEFIGAGDAGIKSTFWDQSESSLKFLDDVKAEFGDSQDLQLYHLSGNSYVKNTTAGSLLIQGDTIDLRPGSGDTGEVMLRAVRNEQVEIRHDNVPKLVTTGYGVTVTGLEVTGISTLTGDVRASANLSVTGLSTFTQLVDINGGGRADTFKVEDLTQYRVVLAGSGGELQDDSKLTFDANSNLNVTGGLVVSGVSTIGSIGISTGLIEGPAIMYIDPATVGDDTGTLVVKGNLQVDGTQTTVNSTTMNVADKNVGIASGAANDAAADGAGITVYSGDGDKTWNWVDATDSWTSSEHIQVAAGKRLGFADDDNTYIHRPAADTIAFIHGGGEKVRISSGGQIGIGITNPSAPLHISGTDSHSARIKIEDNNNGFDASEINVENGGRDLRIAAPQDIFFAKLGGGKTLYIENGGNVGINSSSPEQKLDVNGHLLVKNLTDDAAKIILDDASGSYNHYQIRNEDGTFKIRNSGASPQYDAISVLSTGNIGINSTTPTTTLDVRGTVQVSGISTFADVITASQGIKVNADSTGGADNIISVGEGDDLSMYHQTGVSYLENTSTGGFTIKSNTFRIKGVNGSLTALETLANGAVDLYFNNQLRLETLQRGVGIGGSIHIDNDAYITGITTTVQLKVGANPTVGITTILDEDDMASDSATALATQQSIKKYVDDQVTAQDLDVTSDSGTIAIDLDSETLDIAGTANEIETSATGNEVTIGLPDNVTIGNNLTVTNDVGIGASLNVTGITTLSDSLRVGGHSVLTGTPHNYNYGRGGQDGGLSVYAREAAIEVVGDDDGSHGGSILIRTPTEGFGFIINPSTNSLELKAFTSTGDNFTLHNTGNHVSNLITQLRVVKDGAVELYNNNHQRFNTTGYGVSVSGFESIGIATFHSNVDVNADTDISGNLVVGAAGTTITTTVGAAASVGIGTANPAYMLDVAGAINSSTDVKINGTSVLTSALDEAVAMAIALG